MGQTDRSFPDPPIDLHGVDGEATVTDMETTTFRKFTPGTIVSATSACDSNCVWTFEVTKRTAKFVTLTDLDTGDVMRVGIKTESLNGEGEWALPFGRFSMAPVVRAA